MGLIGFSDKPEEIWYVRTWAFWQILDDVIALYPQDSEMGHEFELAKYNSGLSIDLLEPETAARIVNAIRSVATGILAGTTRSGIHDQPYGDDETYDQYRKILQELLSLIAAGWKCD